MEWYWALILMLGLLVVLLAAGLPVAFTFFTINFIGAWIFLGAEPGMIQNVRSMVGAVALSSISLSSL